jgi:Holliday junction resolvase RusA-like endonuclease
VSRPVVSLTLELAGDPIARAEPRIVRFGNRAGLADSPVTKKGKADWLSVWIAAGSPRLIDGPIELRLLIVVDRPKSHFGTGANAHTLKPTAPRFPETKPDVSNVLKLAEDALKSRAFRDDSQIVCGDFTKRYATDGEHPFTRVELGVLVPLDALFPPTQEAPTT